jgi:hypothetical protein
VGAELLELLVDLAAVAVGVAVFAVVRWWLLG